MQVMSMQPTILFEDTNLLVINKPQGLVVHSDGRTNEYTLADWLIERYPNIREVGEPWVKHTNTTSCETSDVSQTSILRPGIVHRLDRETSGVLLIAKTQENYEYLKSLFKNREIQKEYRAIVNGAFKDDMYTGVIDKQIGKSPRDFRRWSAQPGARGVLREAVTKYEVLQSVGVGNEGYSYVCIKPKTGRTHQIRVHFKAIHHSVLGDPLYGPKKVRNIGIKVPRTMLHAHRISFITIDGDTVTYTAPLPEDFTHVLQVLKLVTV